MPATSRHGESGSVRSASGLAGSPSKSTIFQPLRCAASGRGGGRRGPAAAAGPGSASRRREERRAEASACVGQLGHDRPRRRAGRASRRRAGLLGRRPASRSGSARRAARGPRPPPPRAARPRRRSRRRPRRRAGRPRRTGCARWPAPAPSRRWPCGRNCCSMASCDARPVGRRPRSTRRARRRWSTRPG